MLRPSEGEGGGEGGCKDLDDKVFDRPKGEARPKEEDEDDLCSDETDVGCGFREFLGDKTGGDEFNRNDGISKFSSEDGSDVIVTGLY